MKRDNLLPSWGWHTFPGGQSLPTKLGWVDVTQTQFQTSRQPRNKYLCEDHPRNVCPALKSDDALTISFRPWYFLLQVALFICPWILYLVLSSVPSSSCLFLHCLHLFPGLILSCWYLRSSSHTRLLPCPLVWLFHDFSSSWSCLPRFVLTSSFTPIQLSLTNRQEHLCLSRDKLNQTTACCICFHQVWEPWLL